MPVLAPAQLRVGSSAVSAIYRGETLLTRLNLARAVSLTWAGNNIAVTGTGLSGAAPVAGPGAIGLASVTPGYASDPVLAWSSTATNIANAVSGETYVTFAITSPTTWTPQQVRFKVAAGGTSNVRGWILTTSADGHVSRPAQSLTDTVRPTLEQVTIDISAVGPQPAGMFEIRLYAYGGSGKTLEFDDITVSGTATGTTSTPVGVAPPLRYARPAGWESWPTVTVAGTSTASTLETIDCGNRSVRLVFPDRYVPPVRVENFTDLVVIGGRLRALPVSTVGGQDQRLIYCPAAKGTVHLEGLHLDGAVDYAETDGVAINGQTATVQIQNTRVDGLRGTENPVTADDAAGTYAGGGNHADVFQTWLGVKKLRFHNVTGSSNYQGVKIELTDKDFVMDELVMSNVNLAGLTSAQTNGANTSTGGYLFWLDPRGIVRVTLENVYLKARGTRPTTDIAWPPARDAGVTGRPYPGKITSGRFSWPDTAMQVDGYLALGTPASGDFAPLSGVGANYPAPASVAVAADVRRTAFGTYRPSASTTGAYGALNSYSGDLVLTTAGQVVEGYDVSGIIRIKADNVTVRRCIARGGDRGADYAGALIIALPTDQSGAVIEDCSVIPSNAVVGMNGVQVGRASVRRLNVSGTTDGILVYGDDTSVLGCYVHDTVHYDYDPSQSDGSHDDSVQFEGGNRTRLIGNSLTGAYNSGVQVTQNAYTITDLRIDRNWLGGGNITVNTSEKGKGAYTLFRLTDNVFDGTQRNTDGVHAAITAATRSAMVNTGNTVTGGVTFKTINAGS